MKVIPRLPAKDLDQTRTFFETHLQFSLKGIFPDYLIMEKGEIELHFFHFPDLDPLTNYAMVYVRMEEGIETLYEDFIQRRVPIHPNGPLEIKPWGMKEFAVLDPNHTLLTFGQIVE
jgi:catechol 2,3-dioxygenase-like lactoylglutathione lyase family enzyme